MSEYDFARPTAAQLKTAAAISTATMHEAGGKIGAIGIAELVEEGLGAVRKEGYFNLFAGFPRGGAPVPFDPNLVHYSEVLLTGSQNATADQYRRTLRLLRTVPHIDEVVTNRYGVEESQIGRAHV